MKIPANTNNLPEDANAPGGQLSFDFTVAARKAAELQDYERRLDLRDKCKVAFQRLSETAKAAGLGAAALESVARVRRHRKKYGQKLENDEAARIEQNTLSRLFGLSNRMGLRALYDGRDTRGLAEKKGIAHKEYWDRAGADELLINFMRMKKTRHILENLPPSGRTAQAVMAVTRNVGLAARAHFMDTRGDGQGPETLRAETPLREIAARIGPAAAPKKAA